MRKDGCRGSFFRVSIPGKYKVAILIMSSSFLLSLMSPDVQAQVPQTGSSSQSKNTIRFRIRGEPETLDWNLAHTEVEAYLLMNLMEGLVTFDSQGKVRDALAANWDVSLDGKVYTFHLHPGIKWSDGVPLRADDFLYSWKRLLSPGTAASYAYFLFDIEGAQAFHQGTLQNFDQVGIKVLNDLTLQVKLSQPLPHWINVPAFWVTFPMRQDVVEKYGSAWDTPGRMVTLGPYSIVSHQLNSKFVLRANPGYYGKKGNVDQIEAVIVENDTDAVALFNSGRLDVVTDLEAVQINALQDKSKLKTFPSLKTAYLGFAVEKYPVSSLNFRRAIAMAIDKSKVVTILKAGERPATSFVPPPLKGYTPGIGLRFDPNRAKAELRSSGLGSGKIILDYLLPNWDQADAVAQWVRSELQKNLGIEVVLHPVDNRAFREKLDLHLFPLFHSSWIADYPDSDSFLSLFLSDSGNRRTQWKNEEFDQLVLKARHSTRPEERARLQIQAQKILLEDEVVLVPLYYEPNLALVGNRVKNFELNPLDYLYFRKVNVVP